MLDLRLSYIINLYRFPLAVLVVLIHYLGNGNLVYSATGLFDISGYDWYVFIRILISRVISQVAVPAFFLISGYLFYQKLEVWEWQIWKRKMKSRIHTLVIPYILWITIYVLFGKMLYILKEGITDVNGINTCLFSNWFLIGSYYNCTFMDTNNLSWIGTMNPTCTPVFTPFWFIRDLIFMTLLSPVIYALIKKGGKVFISILLLAYISQIWPVIPGFSIRAFCFFSIGGFLAYNPIKVTGKLGKITFVIALILSLICSVNYHSRLYSLLLPWFVLLTIVSAFSLGNYLFEKQIKMPQLLGKSTFFIFAFHFFLLDIWKLFSIQNHSLLYSMLEYFLFPTIVILFCVIIYYALDRYLNKFTKILVGR